MYIYFCKLSFNIIFDFTLANYDLLNKHTPLQLAEKITKLEFP